MAIATVNGFYLPDAVGHQAAPSYVSMLVDASGEKAAFVLQAPKTGSIRKIHFRTGTVTTPTDTDVRVESVSATTGDPSGSLFGTNTNVTVLSAALTSNTWVTTGALTADAAVTKGDLLAVVIAPTGSPNYNVSAFGSEWGGNNALAFPYPDHFTAAWAKIANLPAVVLEYSDGSVAYQPGCVPASAVNTHTFNNSSTPDEYALYFQTAAPVRVAGAWVVVGGDGDFDLVLYGSDGTTALATLSVDKDIRQTTNPATRHMLFSAPVELLANTNYRLAVKPTSVTNLSIFSIDVSSAALLGVMAGGTAFHHSTRTDAGAWSQTTTRRLWLGLIVDGIDDGTSSGGSGNSIPSIGD